MPLYEYCCTSCSHKFEALRSLSSAGDDAICPRCQGKARRLVSTFASFSKSSDGSSMPIGGSSCGGCAATSCGSCHAN